MCGWDGGEDKENKEELITQAKNKLFSYKCPTVPADLVQSLVPLYYLYYLNLISYIIGNIYMYTLIFIKVK